MAQPKHLFVGGLDTMGFDATGKYLLTVTHSGRGVFCTDTWDRVARDTALSYPTDGEALGIGPIDGLVIGVQERSERQDCIVMQSPDGRFHLVGEANGITVTWWSRCSGQLACEQCFSKIITRGSRMRMAGLLSNFLTLRLDIWTEIERAEDTIPDGVWISLGMGAILPSRQDRRLRSASVGERGQPE